MTDRHRFLFASTLFMGNASVFATLRRQIERMDDVEGVFVPVEPDPPEWFGRIPPVSLNWSVRGSVVGAWRYERLRRETGGFDACWFMDHCIAILTPLRKTTPFVVAMDATPEQCDREPKLEGYEQQPLKLVGPARRVRRAIARSVYRDAAAILPFSGWVKRSVVSDYGVPEEKVVVLPPGIDTSLWSGAPARAPAARPMVLFVGGHFVRKGGDLLLRLAAEPSFAGCDFHLVTQTFQGEAPPNVTVHRGLGPNAPELRRLYERADVFAFPTRADLHPIALLEAMAMELPIVTTTVGAIPEIVLDGKTGLLVAPDDAQRFAERLRQLVESPALRRELGAAGRAWVLERFDAAKNARALVDHLKLVARARRHGRAGASLRSSTVTE